MKLKQYLKKSRIKQKDFALILGIGEAHLSEVANGKAMPSVRLAWLIEKKTCGQVSLKDYCIDRANKAA